MIGLLKRPFDKSCTLCFIPHTPLIHILRDDIPNVPINYFIRKPALYIAE